MLEPVVYRDVPLGRIPIRTVPGVQSDPAKWRAGRENFLRWQLEGKAQIERDGLIVDLVTMASMGSAAELDGCVLVIYDQGVMDAWRAAHGS